MYARFASRVGADELPAEQEINAALLYLGRQFGDGGSRKSHLDRFVELAARAAAAGSLEEDDHYTVVKQGTPEEEVALKLSRTFDEVSKYARDYALDGEDMLNTAGDYRDRIKEAADKTGSYVNAASQYTTGLNRCVRIDSRAATEQLDFDPSSFGTNPRVDDGAVAAAADGGDDAAADGGAEQADTNDEPDRDDAPQYTQAVAETVRDAAEPVGVAYIIRNTEGSAEPLREAIDAAREQGKIREEGDDQYAAE